MDIKQTCIACPTQWEGHLIDGRYVYLRYRFGRVTIDVANSEEECTYGSGTTVAYSADYRDERGKLDGVMEDEEVRELLEKVFEEVVSTMAPQSFEEC